MASVLFELLNPIVVVHLQAVIRTKQYKIRTEYRQQLLLLCTQTIMCARHQPNQWIEQIAGQKKCKQENCICSKQIIVITR